MFPVPPNSKLIKQAKNQKLLSWAGNIRELHNVVERLSILCDKEITADDVLKYAQPMK